MNTTTYPKLFSLVRTSGPRSEDIYDSVDFFILTTGAVLTYRPPKASPSESYQLELDALGGKYNTLLPNSPHEVYIDVARNVWNELVEKGWIRNP